VSLRRGLLSPARHVGGRLVRAKTRSWMEYSRLFAVGERTGWSVDEDARQLAATALRCGYEVAPARFARFVDRQAVFLTSHFEALQPRWLESTHRVGTAYLHGRPGTPGYPEFDTAFETLQSHADRLHAIQVTHAEMHELVLAAGVDPARVQRIAIGIDLEHFPFGDVARRTHARATLEVPDAAFVVGSFQKDGIGWEEGLEPKLVKGPDVLVGALERIGVDAPELFVLLTGPARGYVRRELERLGIPYVHVRAKDRAELARAYNALDVYVVPSRQEGGPKAVLEAMATGTPLVTTSVGQVTEIVSHGVDALVVDVEDAEGLASHALRLRNDASLVRELTVAGRAVAERYDYALLDGAWDELLGGLVDRREAGDGRP
jgi:glycosyltransferase involved in cell wall biosynthesis